MEILPEIHTEKGMCTRCVFDKTVKGITFDEEGVCNFCHLNQKLGRDPDTEGLERLIDRIRRRMRGRDLDCIVAFSGGIDSTFLLYSLKKIGLRPIAVHSDNGWVTEISRRNMKIITDKLNVPFVSLSEDWNILREIYLATLRASVPDVCLACEVKSISELTDFSAREKIPFIFFGYSPRTEGLAPLAWHYVDSRYYNSIMKRFLKDPASARKLNKISIFHFIYYVIFKSVRYIFFPSFVNWDEQKIKELLNKELGWQDFGHHSDCQFYPIAKYINRKKFNIDREKILMCAEINAGRMTKEEALILLSQQNHEVMKSELEPVMKKLGLKPVEFDRLLDLELKFFTDFPSYYSFIKKIKPVIWAAAKAGLMVDGMYEYFFQGTGSRKQRLSLKGAGNRTDILHKFEKNDRDPLGSGRQK